MSLLGFIGKVATGFLAGGPVGAIAGAASGLLGSGGSKAPIPRATATAFPLPVLRPTISQGFPQTIAKVGPGMPPQLPDSIVQRGGITIPGLISTGGTKTTYYSPPGQVTAGPGCTALARLPASVTPGGACACPKGYHLNKTGYYRKGDCRTGQGSGWVERETVCVKNRRRNPLNPRALSRSIARISSAKNAAKFLGRVTVRDGGCGCK